MPDYKQEMKKLLGEKSLSEKEKEIRQQYMDLSNGGKVSIDKVINDVKNEADDIKAFTNSITKQKDDIGDNYKAKLVEIKKDYDFKTRPYEGTIDRIIRTEKKEAECEKEWESIKLTLRIDDDKKKLTLHEFMDSLLEEKESLNQQYNDELANKYSNEENKAQKKEYLEQGMESLYRDYTEVPTFKKFADKTNVDSDDEIQRIDDAMAFIVAYYTDAYNAIKKYKEQEAYDVYKNAVKDRDEALAKAKNDRSESLANIEGADKLEEKKDELKEKNKLIGKLQEYKDSIIPKMESGSPGALSQDAKKAGLDLLAAARAEYRNNCSWWDRLWANILSPERFSKAAYVAKINAYKEALKETGVNDKEIADADPDKSAAYTKNKDGKYVPSNRLDADAIDELNNLANDEEPVAGQKKDKVRVAEVNNAIGKDTGSQEINKDKGQLSKGVKTANLDKPQKGPDLGGNN